MNKIVMRIFCAMLLIAPGYSAAGGLSKSLLSAAGTDTVCNVWVRFSGRGARGGVLPVSDRALARRRAAGFSGEDRAVDPAYIKDIEKRGGRLRHEFPWGNAASFSVHATLLNEIAALPYVLTMTPVAVYVRGDAVDGLHKPAAPRSADDEYGWHGEMVNMRLAHDYIKAKGLGDPGSGIIAAFFDTGFRLGHRAFKSGRDSSGIVAAAYDFVDDVSFVADPRSIFDKHGTQCLGLVAGRDPDSYIGAAWGARFIIARTEDYYREVRTEEDNWAAAVVWAESHGAQIISSSLGYRDGFDDPRDDYVYGDMNGLTTIVALAAAEAVNRGVIVVNSVGNENNNIPGTLISPADVDGVVAVGAVDASGVLARFSSSGPAADGRSKPEVVAPGVSVPLVDPYSHDAYETGNGTSFAAPIVSGIFALILQAHPNIGADEARERLYNSCTFAQGQTVIGDNLHGYGIPNALRAVIGEDEIFVKMTDKSGEPLHGATVRVGAKTETYVANETGAVVISARVSELPLDLRVIYRGETLGVMTVNALPSINVSAFDAVVGGGLKISPNAIKGGRTIKGRYYFSPSDNTPAVAVIRTLDGRTVWSQKLQLDQSGVAEFTWKRAGRKSKTAAGVYFLTVRQGRTSISKKFMIAN